MTSALNGLGEIVSWTSPRSVTIDELRKAMVDANIDESLARDMRPSNAFRRAIKDMEEHRVIRQTLNDNEYLHFQFTSEYLRGGEFHYSKEAELMLHKSTGVVSCSNNELREMAQRMVNEQTDKRSASDITRIVQKLFEDNGDLFPLRDAGGVYFVPQEHLTLCEKVEKLLNAIGGAMKRWEMNTSPRNSDNAAVAVRDSLKKMIHEYETYSNSLSSDDPDVMAKGMKRINVIRMKMNAYKDLLSGYANDVDKALNAVTVDLTNIASGGKTSWQEAEEDAEDTEEEEEPTPTKEPASVADIMALFA